MAPLEQATADLLRKPNYATVSTLRSDGSAQAVVVWVDVDDSGEYVLLNTAEGRSWRRNLERDPRVTVTVPNFENPYEYVSISGRVVAAEQEGADAHIDALAKKYLDKDVYPGHTDSETRVKLTVEPDKVSHKGA